MERTKNRCKSRFVAVHLQLSPPKTRVSDNAADMLRWPPYIPGTHGTGFSLAAGVVRARLEGLMCFPLAPGTAKIDSVGGSPSRTRIERRPGSALRVAFEENGHNQLEDGESSDVVWSGSPPALLLTSSERRPALSEDDAAAGLAESTVDGGTGLSDEDDEERASLDSYPVDISSRSC